MKIVSIDVGIKNLAFCLFVKPEDSNAFQIAKWDSINLAQQSVVDNTLVLPGVGDAGQADYKVDMVNLFKAGNIQGARKLLCGTVRPEEMEEIYTWMYQNLDLFGKDDDQKDSALFIIKQGLCDHAIIADPEINLATVLAKLGRLQKQ
jgi:hypothetical protein